jgi:hypothetical protein
VGKQVQNEYDCNNDMMAEYLAEVRRMEKFFMGLKYGMFHIWTTMMLIIWLRLLPPGHQPHQMLLSKDYHTFVEIRRMIG